MDDRYNIMLLYNTFVLLAFANAMRCDSLVDHLVEDIIATYKMTAPTVIIYDEQPKYCILPWVLCLANNDAENLDVLFRHLMVMHKERKQDGVIFTSSQTNKMLVSKLANEIPSLFISNCPVFMPFDFDIVTLRLDSNIIFFQDDTKSIKLVDKFAVEGGKAIHLVIGNWDVSSGIRFQLKMNRWERRIDLRGATLVSGVTQFDTKYQRWFQEQLSYVTEKLNLTTKERIMPRGWRQFKNGSWGGGIGMVERGEVDVLSNGLGVSLHRSTVLDYTIPTHMSSTTLIGQRPRGNAPDMWVYLRIFGTVSWSIFSALLLAMVMAMLLTNFFSDQVYKNYLDLAIPGLTMVYLYTIQLGSHPTGKQSAIRCLALTISILTLVVFIYYTSDITAQMTSTDSEIPVRTFEDVIYHDYKVVAVNSYTIDLLAKAKQGTAKHETYNRLWELPEYADALQNVIDDPKTLLFSWEGVLVDNRTQRFQSQVYALKMDDATNSFMSFGLQKNSEFCQIFNHYLQKQLEHGINRRLYRKYHNSLYVHKEFGMAEPQALGYENVIFPFTLLGSSIATSILMAMIERLLKNKDQE